MRFSRLHIGDVFKARDGTFVKLPALPGYRNAVNQVTGHFAYFPSGSEVIRLGHQTLQLHDGVLVLPEPAAAQ